MDNLFLRSAGISKAVLESWICGVVEGKRKRNGKYCVWALDLSREKKRNDTRYSSISKVNPAFPLPFPFHHISKIKMRAQ